MSFTGWAVTLNGVTVTSNCDSSNVNEDCDNFGNTLIESLNGPPDGLGLPGLRTEDITFAQRDGVKHYNDWYEPRVITLLGTIGPETLCDECTTARQQLSELIKAWRRSCCDIELVIHTPCDGQFDEGDLILGEQSYRYNLVTNPSFENNLTHWSIAASSDFLYTRETTGGWVGTCLQRIQALTTAAWSSFQFPDAFNFETFEVVEGLAYAFSGYVKTSLVAGVTVNVVASWYDVDGSLLSQSTNGTSIPTGDVWTRASLTATAPTGAASARLQFFPQGAAVVGKHVDLDGVLIEQSSTVNVYFDGDTVDTDNPVDGGVKTYHVWSGSIGQSASAESSQTYEVFQDRSLYGPVGIIGRPRIATYDWVSRKEQIADYTLRFDATDHLMYVLDDCGTPGYQQCRSIRPGNAVTCRTYPRCYGDSGMCYGGNSISSVLPVSIPVGGTERLNPLIVLYPNLSYPTVTNLDTGESVTFNGPVLSEPIVIDTKEGTAKGQSTGNSYTHLLSGVIFLTIVPGTQEFSLFSRGPNDTGSASVCWRDAVVSV